MKNLILAFITILLIVGFNSKNEIDIQDFEIFSSNGKYVVRGKIDLKEHFQSDQADEVIQWAADQLNDDGEIFFTRVIIT